MLYDCPECALPAVVTPSERRASAHGPVLHIFIRCVTGHWFLGPADLLIRRDGSPHTAPPSAASP